MDFIKLLSWQTSNTIWTGGVLEISLWYIIILLIDSIRLILEPLNDEIIILGVCQVKPALPILQRLIHLNDEEVLTDACWALSYLSDGPNDKIQAVIEAGVCPRLVELLMWVLLFFTIYFWYFIHNA